MTPGCKPGGRPAMVAAKLDRIGERLDAEPHRYGARYFPESAMARIAARWQPQRTHQRTPWLRFLQRINSVTTKKPAEAGLSGSSVPPRTMQGA